MISVLTINHNNSEMSFLEKFSFNKDNLQEALLSLKNIGGIDECMILSTCNRVELYVSSDKKDISFSLIVTLPLDVFQSLALTTLSMDTVNSSSPSLNTLSSLAKT